MPWKETCAVDQRIALLADWLRDEWTMTELAERYGISRKTAYKWVDRYDEDGAPGLAERSRAPHTHGRVTAAAIGEAVLALRRKHPRWGPTQLRAILCEREPRRTMGRRSRRRGRASSRNWRCGG